jgi:hypothetical protein
MYTELSNEPSGQPASQEGSMDAPFEVLEKDKKPEKPRFKGIGTKKKESK